MSVCRRISALPPFTYRTGTLTITVTSTNGKTVQIDGLAVS